jgi:hypothetical protein
LKPAADFGLLPRGEYVTHIIVGDFGKSNNGKPFFRLTFEVIEGEHAGRRCWYRVWLTEAARPQARRDFDRLGITDPENQLEKGIPFRVIRCRVRVTERKGDNGDEYNEVKTWEVLGIDPPQRDPFAPSDNGQEGGQSR